MKTKAQKCAVSNDKQPKILKAAFALETIAHLNGRERELLPLADHLRDLHKFWFKDSTGIVEFDA